MTEKTTPTAQSNERIAIKAIEDVVDERNRQINEEGWTPKHDDVHAHGEISAAGACYALQDCVIENERLNKERIAFISTIWPWSPDYWNPKDRRRNLVRAAALIIAEIERLDRCPIKQ